MGRAGRPLEQCLHDSLLYATALHMESSALARSAESPHSIHFSYSLKAPLYVIYFICFICAYVHVWAVHICVPVCVKARGQPWVSFHFSLETAFLTGLECLKPARPAGQQIPGIYLTLASQHLDYITLGFGGGVRGWNLGTHASKASMSSTEPRPLYRISFFQIYLRAAFRLCLRLWSRDESCPCPTKPAQTAEPGAS